MSPVLLRRESAQCSSRASWFPGARENSGHGALCVLPSLCVPEPVLSSSQGPGLRSSASYPAPCRGGCAAADRGDSCHSPGHGCCLLSSALSDMETQTLQVRYHAQNRLWWPTGRPSWCRSRVPRSLGTPFSQHSLPTSADTSSVLSLPELPEAPFAPSPEWPRQLSEARWAQVLRRESLRRGTPLATHLLFVSLVREERKTRSSSRQCRSWTGSSEVRVGPSCSLETLAVVQTFRAALMEGEQLPFPNAGCHWSGLGEVGTEAAVIWDTTAPLPPSSLSNPIPLVFLTWLVLEGFCLRQEGHDGSGFPRIPWKQIKSESARRLSSLPPKSFSWGDWSLSSRGG